jgi:hypothetical protein
VSIIGIRYYLVESSVLYSQRVENIALLGELDIPRPARLASHADGSSLSMQWADIVHISMLPCLGLELPVALRKRDRLEARMDAGVRLVGAFCRLEKSI